MKKAFKVCSKRAFSVNRSLIMKYFQKIRKQKIKFVHFTVINSTDLRKIFRHSSTGNARTNEWKRRFLFSLVALLLPFNFKLIKMQSETNKMSDAHLLSQICWQWMNETKSQSHQFCIQIHFVELLYSFQALSSWSRVAGHKEQPNSQRCKDHFRFISNATQKRFILLYVHSWKWNIFVK